MNERRLILLFSLACIAAFLIIGFVLTLVKTSGSANAEIFGQTFSSSNVGIAIILVSAGMLVFTVKQLLPDKESIQILDSSSSGESISWQQTIDGIDTLVLQLTASDGFRPDLVVGICGGGLMVADLVAKRLGHIPCVAIWSDRHNQTSVSSFDGAALPVNSIDFDQLFVQRGVSRVLLIDDVIYSGSTLMGGVEFIRTRSGAIQAQDVTIKTAALFTLTTATAKADFCVYSDTKRRRMMPSSDRLRRLSG